MASSVAVRAPSAPPRKVSIEARQQRWGWFFLSPWIIGFFAFTLFPIAASLVFSFTDFNLSESATSSIKFIGLDNWVKLTTDPGVRDSLGVTLTFLLLAVPVSIALPLGLATLLNSKYLLGRRFFRTLFYMPYIIPVISSIFVWQAFLNGSSGWLNRLLALIGITGPSWLQDKNYVFTALLLMGIWGVGNAMLTMLASLQGVPTDLYEAARVDGASAFTVWRKITVPLISPVIFYNLILSVIGLLQYFVVPYIVGDAGRGRPDNMTYFYNVHLYKTAFSYQDMGYGAAQAWLIFLIALAITGVLFLTSRFWVYYAGE